MTIQNLNLQLKIYGAITLLEWSAKQLETTIDPDKQIDISQADEDYVDSWFN
jgi:hypothetical protein